MNQEKDIAARGRKLLKDHGGHGDIAVFVAAGDSDVDVLKWLKKQGIAINVRDESDNWQTPMHYAASQGAIEGMEWLKTQGLDINARDKFEQTPMHLATSARSLKSIKALFANCGVLLLIAITRWT